MSEKIPRQSITQATHPVVDSNQLGGMLKLVPLLAGFLSCRCCVM